MTPADGSPGVTERSVAARALGWSWRVGRLSGIAVRVHVTFLLLLVWVGLSHWLEHRTTAGALAGVGFLAALVASILSHELGHVLTARWFRISTREVTLLPIGGVARLQPVRVEPGSEIWIASAGPLVSLFIAFDLYLWLWFEGRLQSSFELTITSGPFFERLMIANAGLAIFNLIPALPMDGGRILRAILARRRPRPRATEIAATAGHVMAWLAGAAGLFFSPLLVFIALIVWMGAAHEIASAHAEADTGEFADHQH